MNERAASYFHQPTARGNARTWTSALALAGCATLSACHLSERAAPEIVAEAPAPCAERRGAYCLLGGDVEVRVVDQDEAAVTLEVSNRHLPAARSFLVEKRGCAASLSDRPVVTSVDTAVPFRGERHDRAAIRLHIRDCSIDFYFPGGAAEPRKDALALLLTEFRPCREQACLGPPLMAYLPELKPR